MTVCFITEYFPAGSRCDIRGGAEAVAFHEAKHLSLRHNVEVITSRETGTESEGLIENIKVFRCGRARDYVQKNAFTDRFLFMRSAYLFGIRRKYDLIVGFSILAYPVAWKISKRLNIPCVIRYHDVLAGKWIRNFGISGVIGELFERYALSRNYAGIIAVSDYTAENLKKHFHQKEKVHVVHNGVELPGMPFSQARVPAVVCVSRMVKYKHVDDLLEAVSILQKEFPDLQCSIIGTGPEEMKLRKLASRLGIGENVRFTGFVRDHADVLNMIGASHVLCLPSSLEGFGIVIMEAMACGVPFVAADIRPLREVSDSKGGLFFLCRNVEDLAAKIGLVLRDGQLRNRLGAEGLERSRNFQWNEISKKAEEIYYDAVAKWNCNSK